MEEIILEVDHTVTTVRGSLDKNIYAGLRDALSYQVENAQWIVKHQVEVKGREWMRNWDGRKSVVCYSSGTCRCPTRKPNTHFPTGLLSMARDFLDSYEIKYSLVDVRKLSNKKLDLKMSDEFEVRDYQMEVIKNACLKERGIIKVATGGGKTGIASGIISNLGAIPFIFYVTSVDLLHQAKNELERFIRYHNMPIKIGAVGGGHKDIQDITVMTVQTAVRCLGMKYQKFDEEEEAVDDGIELEDIRQDVCDLIRGSRGTIFDECQHVAAETCQIISDASISAQYRYGFSATPHRDLGDDLLIDACFGKQIANISASFLIKRGYLIKPEIIFIPVNNMTGTKYSGYQKIYKHCLVNNGLRNLWISQLAQSFVDDGRTILILCNQIEHGKILEKIIPGSVFLHGSIKQKTRNEHLEKMRKKEHTVTIASSIFDEGVDVRPLDTLILAGAGKSQTRALQRVGRVLRPFPGKTKATIIDLYDNVKYLKDHAAKREKIYKIEEEFKISYVSMSEKNGETSV